jgi:hypothetical protein
MPIIERTTTFAKFREAIEKKINDGGMKSDGYRCAQTILLANGFGHISNAVYPAMTKPTDETGGRNRDTHGAPVRRQTCNQ